MFAEAATELAAYAQAMGYGVTLTYLGEADMNSACPALIPGTESQVARLLLGLDAKES
jgi:hypothetical protein